MKSLEQINEEVGDWLMNVWITTARRKHEKEKMKPHNFPRYVETYMQYRYDEYKQRKYDESRRQ